MAQMVTSGQPFMVQSFIQQTTAVPLHSGLNREVLSWIQSDLYSGVNFLEVNLICAFGASMGIALGNTGISGRDYGHCRDSCRMACVRHKACEP